MQLPINQQSLILTLDVSTFKSSRSVVEILTHKQKIACLTLHSGGTR